MAPKSKYATEEERKAAQKAQRKEWEKRNPEFMKAKRDRDNLKRKGIRKADTRACKTCKQEKPISAYAPKGGGFFYVCMTCRPDTIPMAQRVAKSHGNEVKTKVCKDCGITKPITDFSRHGTHGRKDRCKDCVKPKPVPKPKQVPKPLQKREEMGYDALERKEKKPLKFGSDIDHNGWILILGAFMPGSMGETAWMRDGILKLSNGHGGMSFQIMGDTKARSWRTLVGVKAALARMGA